MKEKKQNRELPEKGYRILKLFLAPIFKLYYRPIIENESVIPKEGAIILAGNHRHIMDQCMTIISTDRVIHYMAKREYFDGPFAWFFRLTGVIPVDRSIHDENAKSLALDVLKSGKALGIFPEGTRNKTDELLLPFKMGSVSMAKKAGASIVPFAITGKFKFRNGKIKIKYGRPFKVPEGMSLEEANDHLQTEIARLLREEKMR